MKKINIGICGIGRIGKTLLRIIFEEKNNISVKIIKDLKNKNISNEEAIKNLAYLIQNDSTYGLFPSKIEVNKNYLIINGQKIYCDFSENIFDVPWSKFEIDLLIESSGNQSNINNLNKILSKKLKNIIVTRSSKNSDFTLVYGVNEKKFDPVKQKIISLSTCTGNATAPFLKIINDNLIIENGYLSTIHPVLSSEKSLDGPSRLVQLGRASKNVKLIDTAISKSVIEVIPELKSKISKEALSYRIPTDIVSSVYGVLKVKKIKSKMEIIKLINKNSNSKIIKICDGFFKKELVSLDYIKDKHSSIISKQRLSINGDLLRFHIWHDNEYGYCFRIYDAIRDIHSR